MEDAGETWEQMKKALLCFCRSEKKTFDRVLDREDAQISVRAYMWTLVVYDT